ncbi:IS21 family transposase [Niallia taxi]|uniref:IS21 family transposase n=1 Tax=Niallia taxi TaxID=2499688 RepID=UPI003982C9AE
MEEKLMLYLEVHQLTKQRLRVSQIAKRLKISRTTVYKYLEMTFEEAVNEFDIGERKKILDPYRDWIVNWLKEYPSLSGAQIFDWLQERFPNIKVGESTVRRYVNEVRELYQIEKKEESREYESVDELPPGKQLQVDWGQSVQKDMYGKEVRLYFIAFVLAHSRHKYMWWINRPFTTEDTMRYHELAFQYYGGVPEEVVYDQDNLIAVSENAGDLILTKGFQKYIQQRKFRVYLCRKADPESKGKVENVVKYIKNNFAKNRVYSTLEDWNNRSLKWLERTGNFKVHNTTKKRPYEVFLLEKQHLRKISNPLSYESNYTEIITRNVRKDNTVHFKSNRYSVPVGTYTRQVIVHIHIADYVLKICDPSTGEIIAEHSISQDKGRLVKNRNHSRERSKSLDLLRQELIALLAHEKATNYIDKVSKDYGRYRRDQFTLIKKVAQENKEWVHLALEKCIDEGLYSANSFRDVVGFLKQTSLDQQHRIIEESDKIPIDIEVQTRGMDQYLQLMGGKYGE